MGGMTIVKRDSIAKESDETLVDALELRGGESAQTYDTAKDGTRIPTRDRN